MAKVDDMGKRVALHFYILQNAKRAITGVFGPSLLSYFMWSFLVYLACVCAVVVGSNDAESFFCAVEPQLERDGVGCTSCPATSLMCSKSQCYRSAVNITLAKDASAPDKPLFQAFSEASMDVTCNTLLQNSGTNPVQMIVAIAASSSESEGCKNFHCGVLVNALTLADLNSATGKCTNQYGTKRSEDAGSCVCSSLITDALTALEARTAVESVCGKILSVCPWGTITPSWCPTAVAPSPAATTIAPSSTPAGAAQRRLEGRSAWPVPSVAPVAPAPSPTPRPPSSPGQRSGSHVGEDQLVGLQVLGEHTPSVERRLQTQAPSASGANSALADWTVGAWSPCTCYQQCQPGVKQRLVQCLSAQCKDPKPAALASCRCPHCALCDVSANMTAMLICFAVQAGLALFVFGSYAFTSTLDEENLVKISIVKKLIGFFSKRLPPLVRLITLATFIQVVVLVFMTFLGKAFNVKPLRDCFASNSLRVVSVLLSCLWLAQLLLGRCALKYTRKPPWLYVPLRSSWPLPFRQFGKLVRCLGP